tara:strand:+ start:3004 stop:3579 length:576 start_codon:yes stop_codon:yes gene_type:complete
MDVSRRGWREWQRGAIANYTTAASVSYARHGGIVQRFEVNGAGDPDPGDFKAVITAFKVVLVDPIGVAHIAKADGTINGMSVAGAGQPADALFVPIQGFTPNQVHIVVISRKACELFFQALALLLEQGGPAQKIGFTVEFYGPGQPGFERGMVGRQVRAPCPVAFFQSQAFNRAVSGVPDAKVSAGIQREI